MDYFKRIGLSHITDNSGSDDYEDLSILQRIFGFIFLCAYFISALTLTCGICYIIFKLIGEK